MVVVEFLAALFTVLLWFLGGIVAVLLLAMCTPVRVAGMVKGLAIDESSEDYLEGAEWRFKVEWLLGLLQVRGVKSAGESPSLKLRLAGIHKNVEQHVTKSRKPKAVTHKKEATQDRPTAAHRHQEAKWSQGNRISGQEIRELLPEARRLIAKLWRSLHLDARGELIYGFDDPAILGWCEGLRSVVPWPAGLRLEPDYTQARLEGWAELRSTTYPIRVAGLALGTLFRRPLRRIWWKRIRSTLSERFRRVNRGVRHTTSRRLEQ